MLNQITTIVITAWVWGFCALSTILFTVPITLSSILLAPFDPNRTLAHSFGILWAKSINMANPVWKLNVTGQEFVDPQESYVIISNHQSVADIVCLYHINAQFKWVAKKELFHIPFLGWSMFFMRYIPLKRGNVRSIRDSLTSANTWLSRGISILIFPEGTRSADGTLGSFKNGAFKLALENKCKILPVVVYGNENIVPKGKSEIRASVTTNIKILPPVETKHLQADDFEELKQDLRQQFLNVLPPVSPV